MKMADICTTCLSRDNTLSSIGQEQLQILNKLCYPKTLILNNRIVKICRECDAGLRDVISFQNRALHSLDCLKDIWNGTVQVKPLLEIEVPSETELPQKIQNNNLVNIKIESIREVLDETEIDIKCEKNSDEEDDVDTLNTEEAVIKEEGHVSSKPGNSLNIVVAAEKGLISVDATQLRTKGNVEKNKMLAETKKHWYIEKLLESEMSAIIEQNRQRPAFLNSKYTCYSCAFVFGKKSLMEFHNNNFHKEEVGQFECTLCQSRFSDRRKLSIHRTLHVTSAYVCICGFRRFTKREIIAHRCTDSESLSEKLEDVKSGPISKDGPKHACKYCDKKFKCRGNILRHIQLTHKDLPRVQCDVCSRYFKHVFALRVHMKSQHSAKPSNNVYYCKICDSWFNSKHTYSLHCKLSGSHAGNRDNFKYNCDQCPLKFYYERQLEAHKRVVHLKQKPFECDQCGLTFSTKQRMTSHIEIKHLNKVPEKKHVCELCGAAFASRATLRNHMYIHSSDRPFKCSHCGDTFKQSAALYNHNKMVHEGYKREKIKPS